MQSSKCSHTLLYSSELSGKEMHACYNGVYVCKSTISFSLTSCGKSVWCGTVNTPTPYFWVCCLSMCLSCPSVNVFVRVYKLRHRHLNTACLSTFVLSNSSDVCLCVHAHVCVCMSECAAESILPEARSQTAAAENKNLCQRVSQQTSLTHRSTINKGR